MRTGKRFAPYAVGFLLILLVVWFGGGTGGQGQYRVEEAGTTYRLTLTVEHPGLFEDLRFGPVLHAEAGGRPVSVMKPWPGDRVRAFSLYQRPLVLTLAEGNGPFRLSRLPFPVGADRPALTLPDGWLQADDHVGRFTLVEVGSLRVAVPEGSADPGAIAGQVAELYAAGSALVGIPSKKAPLVVPATAEPLAQAEAVMDNLLPGYGEDLAWWREGMLEYGILRLMDQTDLWSNREHEKWLHDPARSEGLRLVIWLDMSLKSQEHTSVDKLLQAAYDAQSLKEFLKQVQGMGNLAIADTLERMLKGREPMPSFN